MSFASFVFGAFIMLAGFFMIRKTDFFLESFGDLTGIFGYSSDRWTNWKIVGILFMLFGFLIAFGILQLLLYYTVGQLLPGR